MQTNTRVAITCNLSPVEKLGNALFCFFRGDVIKVRVARALPKGSKLVNPCKALYFIYSSVFVPLIPVFFYTAKGAVSLRWTSLCEMDGVTGILQGIFLQFKVFTVEAELTAVWC